MNRFLVEYVWLDGTKPVTKIRSKARMVFTKHDVLSLEDTPDWMFDGSSTYQSVGDNSDCILKPVHIVDDTTQGPCDYLVLCEVYNPDGKTPHASNTRAQLRKTLTPAILAQNPWLGFEQEYTLFRRNIPLGWPEHGYPAPQGPYYCGVGSEQIFGRDFVLHHAEACLDADLLYYGMNAEVMPGQWEFQIGYRGYSEEDLNPLTVCDHLWLARFMMHKISELYDIHVSLDNKPAKGDWNGAGMHTNFSVDKMRQKGGLAEIEGALEKLSIKHKDHIIHYGDKLEERLTGRHETSSIEKFSHGVANRGTSVRIPRSVHEKGCGYFEDRRPGANADPYLVANCIISAVCD